MKKIKTILSVVLVLSVVSCLSTYGSNHGKGSRKDNLIDSWDILAPLDTVSRGQERLS